jgi:hypothetical protein
MRESLAVRNVSAGRAHQGRQTGPDRPAGAVTALARALDLPEDQLQTTSVRTGDGIADLGASILAAVAKGPDA